MSNSQKLKDVIAEYKKANKDVDERVSTAANQRRQTRQERTEK